MSVDRIINQYDPERDCAMRHPAWSVKATDLHGLGEVLDMTRRLILVDPNRYGRRYAIAHAVAHLDLEHVNPRNGGAFTSQQEWDAHWLASMRLDAPRARELDDAVTDGDWWDDIPMDGDPTIRT